MKMVKLLDTSGRNEIDAIKLEINTNTITPESKGKDNCNSNNKSTSTYKQSHRNYYLRHREKILVTRHQFYLENREYWKDYYERIKKNNNKDKAA